MAFELVEARLDAGYFLLQLLQVVMQALQFFGRRDIAPPAHAAAAARVHPAAATVAMTPPAADGGSPMAVATVG